MFCAKVRKNPPPNNKTEKKLFFYRKNIQNYSKFAISSKESESKNLPLEEERKVIKKIVEKKNLKKCGELWGILLSLHPRFNIIKYTQ